MGQGEQTAASLEEMQSRLVSLVVSALSEEVVSEQERYEIVELAHLIKTEQASTKKNFQKRELTV